MSIVKKVKLVKDRGITRCILRASNKVHQKPYYVQPIKQTIKQRRPRVMSALEARRIFISEVEEFFTEQYGPIMHTQVNLEDVDTALAEFVGLKREREEKNIEPVPDDRVDSRTHIDKGRGHYQGRIELDAKCKRCEQARGDHAHPHEECPGDKK